MPSQIRSAAPPLSGVCFRAGDPDITLDLQSMIDQAYEAGAHGLRIDYQKECDLPLSPDDTLAALEREARRIAGARRGQRNPSGPASLSTKDW